MIVTGSPVRALLDANVLISYLLARQSDAATVVIVESALAGRYGLILPVRVTAEVTERIRNKPYLARHIPGRIVDVLIESLTSVADTVLDLDEPFPEAGPDRKDDYLFTHAVVAEADYLVSGDRGVRSVGRVGAVEVVSPARFVAILRESGALRDQ